MMSSKNDAQEQQKRTTNTPRRIRREIEFEGKKTKEADATHVKLFRNETIPTMPSPSIITCPVLPNIHHRFTPRMRTRELDIDSMTRGPEKVRLRDVCDGEGIM